MKGPRRDSGSEREVNAIQEHPMENLYLIMSVAALFSKSRVGKLVSIIVLICVLLVETLHG